jgi:hypothetical protein
MANHQHPMGKEPTSIGKKITALRQKARARPALFLLLTGGATLLAYLVYALLPLGLPDTDRSHFPPYLALPEGDFSLSNYYFLYAVISVTAFALFGLYIAALAIAGNGTAGGAVNESKTGGGDDGGDRGKPAPALPAGATGGAATVSRKDNRILLLIFGFAILFHLVMLAVPTLLSTDIFDYIRHARILAVYGENPLIIPATYFPTDPFYNLGGWLSTSSVYGPLHIYITGLLASIAGDGFSANFFLFRGFFIAMNLVNLLLIWRITARVRPGLELRALLFFGWNPFILILVVSNAHNDILMLTLVLAGFLQYLDRRILLGALFLTLAVLVKFISLPILFIYIAMVLRRQKGLRRRVLTAAGFLAVFAAAVVICYAPLWAGRQTFSAMATVGSRANFTLPGLLRDLVAGHFQLHLANTLIQLTFAVLMGGYVIWHLRNVRDFGQMASASAGIAFLTPFALFWFQPWYLTLALGLVALRPWGLLFTSSLVFSFSVMFFDSFWWHTPVSMDIQKPLRVLVVFGTPILFLLVMKARGMLPSMWQKTVRWSLAGAGPLSGSATAVSDPSPARMVIEVAALLAAGLVPMAVVVSTSPQLRSLVNLVVVKLHLLLNI